MNDIVVVPSKLLGGHGKFYLLKENNKLHMVINRFLMHVALHGGRSGYPASAETIRVVAYSMRELLILANSLSTTWDELTAEQINSAIDYRIGVNEDNYEKTNPNFISVESMNLYSEYWAAFYAWADNNHLINNVIIYHREKEVLRRVTYNDMLDYSKKSPLLTTLINEFKRKPKLKPTTFPAMSYETFWLFLKELIEIDEVYAGQALVMVFSGMRQGGVRSITHSEIFKHISMIHKTEFAEIQYIKKGEGVDKIQIPTHVLKWIDDIYLKKYNLRHKKYLIKRRDSNSRLSKKRFQSHDPLWITKHGNVVSKDMIHNRFKQASKALGLNISPHDLRHSFAVWLVLIYFSRRGMDIGEFSDKNIPFDLFSMIRRLLGHKAASSTLIYLRTAGKVFSEKYQIFLVDEMFKTYKQNIPNKDTDDEYISDVVKYFFIQKPTYEPVNNQR